MPMNGSKSTKTTRNSLTSAKIKSKTKLLIILLHLKKGLLTRLPILTTLLVRNLRMKLLKKRTLDKKKVRAVKKKFLLFQMTKLPKRARMAMKLLLMKLQKEPQMRQIPPNAKLSSNQSIAIWAKFAST